MGSLTNYLENKLLDHVLNNVAYTPAATLYLALATGDPGEAATGASMSEVPNSGNYSRKAITVGNAASRRVTVYGIMRLTGLAEIVGEMETVVIDDRVEISPV